MRKLLVVFVALLLCGCEEYWKLKIVAMAHDACMHGHVAAMDFTLHGDGTAVIECLDGETITQQWWKNNE